MKNFKQGYKITKENSSFVEDKDGKISESVTEKLLNNSSNDLKKDGFKNVSLKNRF